MKSLVKLSLVAGLLVAGASSAMAGEFGIGGYGTKVEMEGNFNYLGSDISTKNDLGMTKKDSTVIPTLSYKTKNSVVFVDYVNTKHEGSSTLTRSIDFDGTTYTAASNVDSSLEMTWGRVGMRYNVGDLGTNGLVGLNVGGDIHVIKLEVSINDGTINNSYDVTFGMPTLALGLDVKPVKNVTLFGEINGMSFGSYGSYVEYDTGVKIACPMIKGVEWKVGYKSKEFDLEAEVDEKFNLEFKGAYAGLTYNF